VTVVAPPNDENYPAYLEALGEAFRGLDRFAMVFDTGGLSRFPARYRELQTRWLDRTRPEFEGRWMTSAFVIRERVIRGVLRTMFWVSKPYYDARVFAHSAEAFAWTLERMKEWGPTVE